MCMGLGLLCGNMAVLRKDKEPWYLVALLRMWGQALQEDMLQDYRQTQNLSS